MMPFSYSLTPAVSAVCRARTFRGRVFGAILTLGIPAQPVYALLADCTVSTSGVSFGAYNVFSPAANDTAGDISVACTGLILSLSVSYSILLSTGGGSYASRLLSSGANNLAYNLYTNSTRSIVWGDGSAGTAIVSDGYLLGLFTVTKHYPVYGRIPAGQNAYVGAYSASVIVTVNY